MMEGGLNKTIYLNFFVYKIDCLIVWLWFNYRCKWSTHWLIYVITIWLNNWLLIIIKSLKIDWLIAWLIDWSRLARISLRTAVFARLIFLLLIDWWLDIFIDWLIDFMIDWLNRYGNCNICQAIQSTFWLLIEWNIDLLIYSLIDWLI